MLISALIKGFTFIARREPRWSSDQHRFIKGDGYFRLFGLHDEMWLDRDQEEICRLGRNTPLEKFLNAGCSRRYLTLHGAANRSTEPNANLVKNRAIGLPYGYIKDVAAASCAIGRANDLDAPFPIKKSRHVF